MIKYVLKSETYTFLFQTKQGFSTRIMRAKEAMFAAMEKDTLSPPMDDSLISGIILTIPNPKDENPQKRNFCKQCKF